MQFCVAAIQGQTNFLQGFLGSVVGFAQVSQNNMLKAFMLQGRDKFPGIRIGQVTCSALDALLAPMDRAR